ncbi:MAG: hypothetical protein HYZ15_04100 [Sphingobacteriales bacterium]|nr:hypothetical protein [Sphingobacteriales bacterium]
MSIQFLTVIALFLQLPDPAQDSSIHADPFTSPSTLSVAVSRPSFMEMKAELVQQKIQLSWKVQENQSIDYFEIEKNMDGKHYKLAALVFGTDTPEAGSYLFFDKASGEKISYRIRLISKDNQVILSERITTG